MHILVKSFFPLFYAPRNSSTLILTSVLCKTVFTASTISNTSLLNLLSFSKQTKSRTGLGMGNTEEEGYRQPMRAGSHIKTCVWGRCHDEGTSHQVECFLHLSSSTYLQTPSEKWWLIVWPTFLVHNYTNIKKHNDHHQVRDKFIYLQYVSYANPQQHYAGMGSNSLLSLLKFSC